MNKTAEIKKCVVCDKEFKISSRRNKKVRENSKCCSVEHAVIYKRIKNQGYYFKSHDLQL